MPSPRPPDAPTPDGGWRGLMTYQPAERVASNATRRPMIRQIVLSSAVVVAFGVAAVVLGGFAGESLGLATAGMALATAAISLGIVIPTFLWVDRLEPEPTRLLWFAFLWGALISTLGALLLNQLGVQAISELSSSDPLKVGAVVIAPVTEELLKGLGVALIFWRARREFNGITDGIVYAGIIAAGFAFVENMFYIGNAYAELGTPGLVGVFVVRGLVSPFAHPMFTVCTGLAFGLIAHRRRFSSIWIVLVGYACAVFLHGLWNYSAVAAAQAYLMIFLLVQVPLFIGFILLLRWSRRRESRLLRDLLTGYGINGWYTPAEVAMLADPRERRRARGWARRAGGRRAERAMQAFQDESGELAMVRAHINADGIDQEWLRREEQLLRLVTDHRRLFVPGV